MHAINDVGEKYGARATYRWFYQGTYIIRKFPFLCDRSNRYTSIRYNSVVWNYLSGHVSGIIYCQRQPTSTVNRVVNRVVWIPKSKPHTGLSNRQNERELLSPWKNCSKGGISFEYATPLVLKVKYARENKFRGNIDFELVNVYISRWKSPDTFIGISTSARARTHRSFRNKRSLLLRSATKSEQQLCLTIN